MKVKVIKDYTDLQFNRLVKVGEVFEVEETRAGTLIRAKVAEPVEEKKETKETSKTTETEKTGSEDTTATKKASAPKKSTKKSAAKGEEKEEA